MDHPPNNQTFKAIARVVVYALLAALSAKIIQFDAGLFTEDGRKFTENSFTEWMQVAYILGTALLFILSGKKFAPLRPIAYLVGGGFLVILIREMDGYLDTIYHGAWLPFALAALAGTLAVVYRHRQNFWDSVSRFLSTPAFGYFAAGGIGLMVFSRLFGSKNVWTTLFQVDWLDPFTPMYFAKSAVQEGSELFAYCLLFCAAVELFFFVRRQQEGAPGN